MIEIEKAEQLGAWAYQVAGLEYKVLRLYVPALDGYMWFDGDKGDWKIIDDEKRAVELEAAHILHQASDSDEWVHEAKVPRNYG